MLFSIADGFAITINVYDELIKNNNLESTIISTLNSIDYNNILDIQEKSEIIKRKILNSELVLIKRSVFAANNHQIV